MISSSSLNFSKYAVILSVILVFTCGSVSCEEADISKDSEACAKAKQEISKGVSLSDGSDLEMTFYKRAIEACPSLAEAHYNLGLILLKKGDAEQAAEAFSRAMERKKDDTKFVLAKGLALLDLNRLVESQKLCEQVREKELENIKALSCLALVNRKRGDLKQAKNFLIEAKLYDPDNKQVLLNLAAMYEQAGDNQKAIEEYESLLELNSEVTEARFRLALLYIKENETQKAWNLVDANTGLTGDRSISDSVDLLSLKAYLAKQKGDLDQAEAAFRRAIGLSAANQRLQVELAKILIMKRQPQIALEQLKFERELDVGDDFRSDFYNTYGWAELDLGNLTEAEKSFERALALNKENAEACNNLGVLYLRTKKLEKAEKFFLQAIDLKPELTVAKENLETLHKNM